MAASDTLVELTRELRLSSDHVWSGKRLARAVQPYLDQLATEIDELENPPEE